MLLQIRDFIQKTQVISDQQLSREFNIDVHALQPILDIWIRKGVIERVDGAACKSECFNCNSKTPVFYAFKR